MAEKTNQSPAPADDAADEFILPSTWNSSEALRLDGDAVEKLARLGAKATGATPLTVNTEELDPGLPPSIPIVIVHGETPRLIGVKDLAEHWRTHPARRAGIAKVGDVASFCELTNRHKTEHSVVFADSDWKKPSLQAVIDYHDIESCRADNGRHRIRYDFPFSDEWKVWLEHDGKVMDQADFAEFIEERAPDMTTLVEAEAAHFARELQLDRIGTPAHIFELARGLEINVASKVKQNVKLQSGEAKLVFEEEHSGRDGQPVTVPGAFALSIPLFYNQDPITVPVRLRYRVAGGAIVWVYKLFRVDRMVADAVDHAKAEVDRETGLPVYEGSPEMAANGTVVCP